MRSKQFFRSPVLVILLLGVVLFIFINFLEHVRQILKIWRTSCQLQIAFILLLPVAVFPLRSTVVLLKIELVDVVVLGLVKRLIFYQDKVVVLVCVYCCPFLGCRSGKIIVLFVFSSASLHSALVFYRVCTFE